MITIEPISLGHNRLAFRCGNEKMDRYIQETAQQAKRKKIAVTFVAVDMDHNPSKILGYYALSSFSINGIVIPEVLRKKRNLPAHAVGATLLGRLAVAKEAQRQGIGTLLVVDALKRSYRVSGDVGSTAVVVDALEGRYIPFYQRLGFIQMLNDDNRLLLMMDTIATLLPRTSNSVLSAEPQLA